MTPGDPPPANEEPSSAREAVHKALTGFLADGDLLLNWTVTMEVEGQQVRYLEHRAGGGIDGTDAPYIWTVIGLLEAALASAHDQMADLRSAEWRDNEPDDDEDANEG